MKYNTTYGKPSTPPLEGKGEVFSLRQLNLMVRDAVEMHLPDEYWVEAELAECRESRGHCYMELVENDERTKTPVARASAKCWRQTWAVIEPHFVRVTGQPLHAGMKVLLRVYAQYHEAYGFSWIVTDIDPTFTIGDLARRRAEIIAQLKQEGVFDLQKGLRLPVFCQRIAIISSATAAGYGDFCRQLEENDYGFVFHTELFNATMQGEQTEQSIINALNEIYAKSAARPSPSALHEAPSALPEPPFDCVVIIRGGGATADMSGFDTLLLAENVAQFPLPIITGIGHDRDECILDMVSHRRVKTPTAAAALLIEHLGTTYHQLETARQRIATAAQHQLADSQAALTTLAQRIPILFKLVKTREDNRLDRSGERIRQAIERQLTANRHRLALAEERIRLLDPQLLLARGYSITLLNGHALTDATQAHAGDEIETRLAKGTLHAVVK